MDLTPCAWCPAMTIAQYDWRDASKETRQEWRKAGLAQYKGSGLCSACYQRAKREGFPPPEEVAEEVAANARRSERRHKERAARYLATRSEEVEILAEMRAAGKTYREIGAEFGIPTEAARRLAMRSGISKPPQRNQPKPTPIDPNPSPNALEGGQWVTCPRRRIQVWREAS